MEKFFTRHSIKPKGEDAESEIYKGISKSGVELTKQRAIEILSTLEDMEDGSILFIGGATDAVRTKSTALAYGDEVKRILQNENRDDILAFTKNDFSNEDKILNKVVEIINKNNDKKILIDTPLFLKEFAIAPWLNEKGDLSGYLKELFRRNNNDETACVKDWFENKGKIGELIGPNPTEVAEDHLKGIERLKDFAEKIVNNRDISVGIVGHSFNLDALAVYLANNGEVTPEGFDNIGGELISETQMGKIQISKDGKNVFKYGGAEYDINVNN